MANDLGKDSEPESGAAYFGSEVRAWRTERGMSQRELVDTTRPPLIFQAPAWSAFIASVKRTAPLA